ncbi:hypothetical protein J7400_12880 [Shimia sp. R9_2]|uniref:hypothetical protein n=1 Tax=Shimia sp. R9_2 TaxID=2821112 RepID=UPI001ADB67F2|nr:hypothetical protein [Shimia sp. R9_2]MBO9397575.1 hypothetical protein [Shimia sp. R9_2]
MQHPYRINLIGIEAEEVTGRVETDDGEILGTWEFIKNEEEETGTIIFIPEEHTEAALSEPVSFLFSRMSVGQAIREICSNIDSWHKQQG